jgi:hypothetical protein
MTNYGTAGNTPATAGIIHPLRVRRIYQNGTTATGIVGFY